MRDDDEKGRGAGVGGGIWSGGVRISFSSDYIWKSTEGLDHFVCVLTTYCTLYTGKAKIFLAVCSCTASRRISAKRRT